VADGGTIFLDEVGELPLTTQVRLLRVLENGEFIKVGSSKVQKTNVRIVAATNLNMMDAIQKGKFREDLYYRLSTVDIHLPPLRDRKEDIHLLFRKFASDFAQKYNMPTIRLEPDALNILINHPWRGNIRQLRNITEQISVIEQNRSISIEMLKSYLPEYSTNLPALINNGSKAGDFANEREILYKVLFDMRNDITDLKKLTLELLEDDNNIKNKKNTQRLIEKIYGDEPTEEENLVEIISPQKQKVYKQKPSNFEDDFQDAEAVEETTSLQEKEFEMIKKSLERNNNKRKLAAKELGISERTLYRKIKQFDL